MAKVSHFRYALRFLFTIGFYCCCLLATGQTLGGGAGFNFLSFSSTATATAAGGMNVSYASGDAGFTFQNSALMQPSHHGQLSMHFTSLPAGVKALHLGGAYQHQKWNATLGGHVFLIHYGSIEQRDAAGNVSGNFQAYDYVIQLGGAKKYLARWQYGGALKWIQSFYGPYQSSALALDVGLLYADSLSGFRAGLVAKNMGVQIKKFSDRGEDLPFDLQFGVTKRLLQAPLAFSLTAHHLHRFNLLYNDTTFNNANNVEASNSFFKNIFNHLVFAGHVYLGQHLEATVGYNFLRRSELSFGNGGNGLTGFSAGLSAKFQKLQIHFSRATYAKGIGYNQLGLQLNMPQLGGGGKF